MTHRTVFISYSWDSVEHNEWVLNFADNLMQGGVDVILDQYELSAGKELTYFMERSVGADKILMIMTPNYKLKADKRQGGVGFEYSLITQEYYDKQSDKTKILPVLRAGSKDKSAPNYMKSIVYHDMVDDKLFDTKLFELIKLIYDKPIIVKPKLGNVPDFSTAIVPDIEKKLTDFNIQERVNQEKTALIFSNEGVILFENEIAKIFKNIDNNVIHYKDNHKFYFFTSYMLNKNYTISTINFTFQFARHRPSNNSIFEAFITMNFYKGPVGLEHVLEHSEVEKEIIYKRKYLFKLDNQMLPFWMNENDANDILQTNDVHSLMFREVINNEIDLRNSQN